MEHEFGNLNDALAFYTECQLATVAGLEMAKRTSKYELQRARDIAAGMVEHCRRLGVTLPESQFRPPQTPRLRKLLEAPPAGSSAEREG